MLGKSEVPSNLEKQRLFSDPLAVILQSGQKGAINGFSPLNRKEFPFHNCGMSPPPLLPGVRDQWSGLGFFPVPPSPVGSRAPPGESPRPPSLLCPPWMGRSWAGLAVAPLTGG